MLATGDMGTGGRLPGAGGAWGVGRNAGNRGWGRHRIPDGAGIGRTLADCAIGNSRSQPRLKV